jgi:hypothetical protein
MLLWPPKGSLRKFTLRLKGDLHTTHPPTHTDTIFQLSPKFAIGLEGPTKLKNMAILPKTLCAINE